MYKGQCSNQVSTRVRSGAPTVRPTGPAHMISLMLILRGRQSQPVSLQCRTFATAVFLLSETTCSFAANCICSRAVSNDTIGAAG